MEGVRPATAEDLPRLVELAATAIEELTRGRGGAVWARHGARRQPLDASLAAALDDAGQLVLAGTIHEVVIGYAVAHTERLSDGGNLGVVDDLYVEPEGRGVGVGEAMMNEVIAFCRAAGCFGVDAMALPGDRHTKNFFESFGLVARAIVVHRPLTRDGPEQ